MLCIASTAFAVAPPRGGRDLAPLQRIADARYGPGHVNVATDFYGLHAGENDPWIWQGEGIQARLLENDARGHRRATLGWYRETGTRPLYPGGGVLFGAKAREGDRAVVGLPGVTRLGFYYYPGTDRSVADDPNARMTFTNRLLNPSTDAGPGAAPIAGGGSSSALIFDVSPWSAPGTWLVWFASPTAAADDDGSDWGDDDGDSGGCGHDDASGLALEVTILHATPAVATSFGGLKQRYRK